MVLDFGMERDCIQSIRTIMIYFSSYLLTSIELYETEYLLFLSVSVVDPEGELSVPLLT